MRLHGLQSKPERNGTLGRVLSFDVARGRYAVECVDDGAKLLLRDSNLLLVGGAEGVHPGTEHTVTSAAVGNPKPADAAAAAANAAIDDDDSVDYDATLTGVDFALLRDQLLRATSRPGCASMPGRPLPRGRSCLVGIISVLQRSTDEVPPLVQQACDALSKICTLGAPARSAVRRAGAADALVHAIRHLPTKTTSPPKRDKAVASAEPVVVDITDLNAEADSTRIDGSGSTVALASPEVDGGEATRTGAEDVQLGKGEARPATDLDALTVSRAVCHALTNLANGDLACKLAVAEADGTAVITGAMRKCARPNLTRCPGTRAPACVWCTRAAPS